MPIIRQSCPYFFPYFLARISPSLISSPVNARNTNLDITRIKLQRLRSIHNGKPMRLEFNMRLYRLAFDHPFVCSHPSESRIQVAYLSAIAEVRRLLVIFLNRLCVEVHSSRPFVLSKGFVSLHLECVGGLDVRHGRRGEEGSRDRRTRQGNGIIKGRKPKPPG
ncbi:uncharacterized protein ASPGLDRAFT_1159833 [Aspergillus glaucus CBS 516.65]|uniref:Uncharacterized protein n=1 Tax=Aspergillus glaucus CBS 516.65 TaxID=1160497 RepID=A0A1L9VTU0_ASPGL|nr:hypothetical protein ASPGLDRAFT_1159833 [Aspergillus glaucus CBS 516.65]OJJ87314.1 hypothetical protein ASPGLDRAFT_1159833 [Aspergillus glaucus CBS 516.65]